MFLRLGRGQRLLRSSTRPAALAFSRGLTFRRRTINWNLEQKQDWIRNQLKATLRYANLNTPYYSEIFKKIGFDPQDDISFEDLAQLPVLEREDIHNRAEELLIKSVDKIHVRKDATGGSTGMPTTIWLGPEERGWSESGMEYFFERLNVPSGTRTALFWGHNLDPQATDSFRDRLTGFIENTQWFDCLRLSPEVLNEVHEHLQRWKPARIIAYASALGQLAEFVLEKGYRTAYPTVCSITGAEKLWPRHREAIESAFGRPVHERYGGRDVACLGIQLNPKINLDYTTDWANVLIEPETSDAHSAILVTKLHADVMPMIRYRVGDLARFSIDNRPGYPSFILPEVLGRITDRIWIPDGRWISGLQIPHLLKDFPVKEFVLLQRQDYSVELQLVPQADFGAESAKLILQSLRTNLPGLNVKMVLMDRIERTKANKWRPVISEVGVDCK
ncbi:MAG: hypothetical protein ABR555_13365 [Pyrinomonadaceae bacterium]